MERNDQYSNVVVDYLVYETACARAERYVKRMFVLIITLIIALVVSNCAWLWYMSLYDFESYELSTEGGGDANYIGNDGVINYGEGYSQAQNAQE